MYEVNQLTALSLPTAKTASETASTTFAALSIEV